MTKKNYTFDDLEMNLRYFDYFYLYTDDPNKRKKSEKERQLIEEQIDTLARKTRKKKQIKELILQYQPNLSPVDFTSKLKNIKYL